MAIIDLGTFCSLVCALHPIADNPLVTIRYQSNTSRRRVHSRRFGHTCSRWYRSRKTRSGLGHRCHIDCQPLSSFFFALSHPNNRHSSSSCSWCNLVELRPSHTSSHLSPLSGSSSSLSLVLSTSQHTLGSSALSILLALSYVRICLAI